MKKILFNFTIYYLYFNFSFNFNSFTMANNIDFNDILRFLIDLKYSLSDYYYLKTIRVKIETDS